MYVCLEIKDKELILKEEILTREEVEEKVEKPKMYKVILLNDDYTSMEFVVDVLVNIFHKNASEATKIMLDVHEQGRGIVGVFTYDIANSKILKTHSLAKLNEFPLKAIMERV